MAPQGRSQINALGSGQSRHGLGGCGGAMTQTHLLPKPGSGRKLAWFSSSGTRSDTFLGQAHISGLSFAVRPRARLVSLDTVRSQESWALLLGAFLTAMQVSIWAAPHSPHPAPFTHKTQRMIPALPTPSEYFKHQMMFKNILWGISQWSSG